MGKYDPLTAVLAAHAGPEWRASFAELEAVLGFALPKAARSAQTWWANGAWSEAGWDAAEVDRAGGLVTFRKRAFGAARPVATDVPAILQRLEPSPKLVAGLVAGGVAVVIGLGAFAITRFVRKRGA